MADVMMNNRLTGQFALFHEPNSDGNPEDVNAPRNAPLVDPENNLEYVYLHSDFNPMEVAFDIVDVTVNHASVTAGSSSTSAATVNNGRVYGDVTATHVLFEHDLGYKPIFFLIDTDNNVIHPGFPVQFDSADGRARLVTGRATNTEIILFEKAVQTSNVLAAVSVDYKILIIKEPPSGPLNTYYFDLDAITGIVQMAYGKISSDRKYLQIVEGGTPFGIPLGRTLDFKNGTFRSVSPDGTIRDIVPNTFRISFGNGGPSFGPDGNYNGDFTGDPSVLVQAP